MSVVRPASIAARRHRRALSGAVPPEPATSAAHGARRRIWAAALIGIVAAVLPAISGPLHAQVSGLAAQDRSAPIEITADELVVEQTRRTATFTGSVDAVQGTMRLTAQRLVVHYGADGPEKAATDGAAVSAGGAGEARSIRRIEAFGDVFIAAPGETAQGASGVYDVAGGQLRLEGDVVLTREGNVIRGDRLDVDLVSGLSTLKAAAGGKGGRVRALFQPESGSGGGTP